MSIAEKLTTIAGNSAKVYEAGQKAEYDRFWDAYQENGTRKNYNDAFAYWNDENFYPKYQLNNLTVCYRMFAGFNGLGSHSAVDLVELCEKRGITLDFSNLNTDANDVLQYAFSGARISRVGVVDISRSNVRLYHAFGTPYLVTIDKLILASDGSNTFGSPFLSATALENITIEGVIGQNGISFQWSAKLSRASITSVINALSTATSGLVVTFSKNAVISAFGSTEADEWLNLISTRSNWTISLV